jgi:nitroimidazol reductase NimA-like FMN-containing flavoprotein (pyridoxamine 5'-phosphate oxidase superfamily)
MRRKDREIKDKTEIMAILQKADVCRLAMSSNNVPYIVTMNFGIKNGGTSLYFHCAGEGKKIDILKDNNYVCFQADIEHEFFLHDVSCGCSMRYRSVVGMGRITFVTELSEKLVALQSIMTHYAHESSYEFKEGLVEGTTILRLDIEEISGKTLVKPGHQTL